MTTPRPIRVRMAPSPTGPLHVGTVRTALFNFLFARHTGGTFILRIEDTDLERSEKRYEEEILAGLKWLGITWGEGPYRQSERRDIYERYITQLVEGGYAYYCYCTKEELAAEREGLLSQGLSPVYSGRCRDEHANGRPAQVIRLKMTEAELKFTDLIRGAVSFDPALIGDIAIAKDVRTPLYNLAVVIDDAEMEITHVIRGEDHISNTPKQLALQRALGLRAPAYAHLPLILAPDRSKLSKRSLETSLEEYRRMGFLPDALVNFIALLGWHPAEDREVLSRDELIAAFDLKRVQKGGAIFDLQKLEWMNAHYIRTLPIDQLEKMATEVLSLAHPDRTYDAGLLRGVLEAERTRIKKLADVDKLGGFFFELPEYDTDLLQWKEAELADVQKNLKCAVRAIEEVPEDAFEPERLTAALDSCVENSQRGPVFWPVRAALSGLRASPGPGEIMAVLGKSESIRRLKIAIGKVAAQGTSDDL